jgi:hypothetical protein
VRQRLHRFDEEKRMAIGEEIHKLLATGFIKEVFHPEWLANPVLVKKKNSKWRMCVDDTSLDKACPKHPFPLTCIDQIVDSTSGCETHIDQVMMKASDQLMTSFVTQFEIYCYVTMPFGLKNTGATYQCYMLTVFGDLIGQTVEAYVDDIVVKSKQADSLVADLDQAFKCL